MSLWCRCSDLPESTAFLAMHSNTYHDIYREHHATLISLPSLLHCQSRFGFADVFVMR